MTLEHLPEFEGNEYAKRLTGRLASDPWFDG
jgi:hypothetical protein